MSKCLFPVFVKTKNLSSLSLQESSSEQSSTKSKDLFHPVPEVDFPAFLRLVNLPIWHTCLFQCKNGFVGFFLQLNGHIGIMFIWPRLHPPPHTQFLVWNLMGKQKTKKADAQVNKSETAICRSVKGEDEWGGGVRGGGGGGVSDLLGGCYWCILRNGRISNYK